MKIAAIVKSKGRNVETVLPGDPLAMIVDIMHTRGIGSVVVSHSRSNAAVGIVSQFEAVAVLAKYGTKALMVPAQVAMRKDIPSCNCEDDVARVLESMTRERSRYAIVLREQSVLAGLVSIGDLVAALLQDAQLEAGVLRDMARSRLLSSPAG